MIDRILSAGVGSVELFWLLRVAEGVRHRRGRILITLHLIKRLIN